MPHGSPIGQLALLFAAVVFLLWQTWRGWQGGLVRSGMHFGAIFVALSLGCLAAKLAAMPFGGLDTLPGFIAGMVLGGVVGILLFVTIWILAALLFKRTGHQVSGVLRIFWGVGGAFFGLLIGLTVLWGGVSIVRSAGALAESRVESRGPPRPNLAGGLLTLKQSLELGSPGRFLASVDALPADFYAILLQIGQLTNNQRAMLRLLEYPGLQEILQNPRVVDLVNDPQVIKASREGNMFPLFGNEAVAAAMLDPLLTEQLRKIDLRAALKFALESPPPSPAPSQTVLPAKRK